MSLLTHVIYASRASEAFEEEQIPELLRHARANNARHDLTGMLIYINGAFFQILEGPAAKVESVYAKIAQDARHRHVTRIISEPILERAFDAWTMGYSTVEPLTAGQLIGENDFFNNASCVSRIDAGRAKLLLSALNKKRWNLGHSGMHRALGR